MERMNKAQRAEFAERIIARFFELKRDEGWTQELLAHESDMSPRSVNAVLNREVVPNEETLRKYAAALGIDGSPDEVQARWVKYRGFFNLLGVYLDARPESEHDAIMKRIFAALPPE